MKKSFTNIILENDRTHNVKLFEFTDKVADYMSVADFVVTKPGGLTSSESLVSNLPMIIVNPIPGQEEENAEFLEKHKVGIWLKKGDDIDFTLKILLNDENLLTDMKENTKNLAKPNATKEICETIIAHEN